MGLSYDLISEFVKITNDKKDDKKEGTVYATVVSGTEGKYVRIDGSDLLTPMDTTTDIEDGERVTLMIKDHKAIVTGNVTTPSASTTKVDKVAESVNSVSDRVGTFELVVADKVSTNELEAYKATIEVLIANKATIEDLTATNAKIENLEVKNAEIENLVAEKATIEDLEAVNATIENLKVKDAEIENAVVENLKATTADIKILNADFAQIKTLVNGNLTSDNILSFNLTSGKVTVDDAFIKDAMIDTISAGKINAGEINTNLVSIGSEDGGMLITGSTQQFTDKNGNVRIQIGKDASGDFTFVLYGEDGTGQLINQNGITASAIGDGLIVNNMVSDNAAISGGKLDISSVIFEINNDTSTTIKSSKIYLNDQAQSLEVAFNSLKTKVDTIQEVTIQGDLAAIVDQVQSNTSKIEANKDNINTLISQDTVIKKQVTDLQGTVAKNEETLSAKYTSLSQNLDGFKTTVADTYATKSSVTDIVDNIEANYSTTSVMNSAIKQKAQEISASVSSTYATKNQVNTLDNNLKSNYSTTQQMESAIDIAKDTINLGVSKTYETKENSTSKIQNAVNNIQVGGTNLWVLLDLKTGYESMGNITGSGIQHKTRNTIIPTNGAKQLVYQCWNPNKVANSSHVNRVAFFDSTKAYISSTRVLALNGQTYQWQIIDIPTNAVYMRLGAICGSANKYDTTIKIKFELGNKPTDYSLAPEDVTNDISTAKQEAITSANNTLTSTISNYYTKAQTDSQINIAKEAINLGVSSTYETKKNVESKVTSTLNSAKSYSDTKKKEAISTAATDAASKANNAKQEAITSANNTLTSTISNYYTKAQTDSQINIAKEAINLGVSSNYETKVNVETKINGVTIGGTNLLLNSHFDYDRNWSKGTGVTRVREGFDGGYCMKTVGALKDTRNFTQGVSITKLEKGQQYTATVWIKTQDIVRGTTNPHLCLYATYRLNNIWVTECALSKRIPDGTTAWTKYVLTFSIPTVDFDVMSVTGYARDFTGTIWWDGIKLEKGNKASDWSPSPLDISTDITNAKTDAINAASTDATNKVNSAKNELNTAIGKKANSVDVYTKTQVYTKDETNSQINIAKEAINLGVSSTYETKKNVESKVTSTLNSAKSYSDTKKKEAISTAATDATSKANNAKSEAIKSANNTLTSTISNYYTKSQTDSQINIAKEAINLGVSTTYETKENVQTKINDIQIGGRNLFKGYGENEITLNTYNGTGSYTQFIDCLTFDPADYVGKKFTISFYAKSPNGTTKLQAYNRNGNPRYFSFQATLDDSLGNAWKYYTYTFTNTDKGSSGTNIKNRIEIYAENKTGVLVKKIKIELGNKATDWTPTPEDISADISTAKQEAITSANNTLTSTISNYYTKAQTDSQINIAKEAINLGVSSTYETKKNVESKVTSTLNSAKSYSDTKKKEAISTAATDATSKANNAKSEAIKSANNTLTSTISNYYTKSQTDSQINIAKEAINLSVTTAKKEAITSANNNTSNIIKNYYTKAQTDSQIDIAKNSVTTSVKQNFYTKQETESAITSKKYATESQLQQTANNITSTVSQNYYTKQETENTINNKNFATKSEVQQTADNITYKFSQSGGYNLVRNGNPKPWHEQYWWVTQNGWWYREASNLGIQTADTNEAYAGTSVFNVDSDTTYSFSCWLMVEANTKGTDVYFVGSQNGSDTYDEVIHLYHGDVYNNWVHVKSTFTTGSNIKYGSIRIDNNGRKDTSIDSNTVVFFSEVMLVKGADCYPQWNPNPNEVYDGITEINRDGIKVTSSNINGHTQMSSDGFYINKDGSDVFKVDGGGLSVRGCGGNSGRYIKIENEDYTVWNNNINCLRFGYKNWNGWDGVPEFLMGYKGFRYSETANTGEDASYFGMQTWGRGVKGNNKKAYHDIYYRSDKLADQHHLRFVEDGLVELRSLKRTDLKAGDNIYLRIDKDDGLTFPNGVRTFGVNDTIWLTNSNFGITWGKYLGKEEYNLRPTNNNITDLGHESYRFRTIYATNGVINTSDISLKKNIEPILFKEDYLFELNSPQNFDDSNQISAFSLLNETNTENSTDNSLVINPSTSEDYYEFVKNLPMYTYDYKTQDDEVNKSLHNVGFIAQELADTKIGKEFIFKSKDDLYQYNMQGYVGVLAVALKQSLKEIDILKDEIESLKNKINELKR